MVMSNTGTFYDIPAKNTIYRSNHFSSRLEARWAVFMDSLGIDYDYEPARFDLPSRSYLPDFWVHDVYTDSTFWLEVKPKFPTSLEINLMAELCLQTGLNGMIWYGSIPFPDPELLRYERFPDVGLLDFIVGWEDGFPYYEWFDCKTEIYTFNRDSQSVETALRSAIYTHF